MNAAFRDFVRLAMSPALLAKVTAGGIEITRWLDWLRDLAPPQLPLLDIIDLAGVLTSHEQGRRVAEAMMQEINRELERVGVRIIGAAVPGPPPDRQGD